MRLNLSKKKLKLNLISLPSTELLLEVHKLRMQDHLQGFAKGILVLGSSE